MDRRKLVTLTNLCMITKGDEILVIDRQKKDWPGITFPGGHVENDESIVDSVIREVKEETGLVPSQIRLIEQTISSEDQCLFDYYEAIIVGDKERITYQDGETDGHVWIGINELSAFMKDNLLFRHQKILLKKLIEKQGDR